jgi:hypothetical protein
VLANLGADLLRPVLDRRLSVTGRSTGPRASAAPDDPDDLDGPEVPDDSAPSTNPSPSESHTQETTS